MRAAVCFSLHFTDAAVSDQGLGKLHSQERYRRYLENL